jgi:hypothetical protein
MKSHHRSALALLTAVGLAGCEIISAVDHDAIDAPICPSGATLCSDACWDLRTSPQNCGVCGNACPIFGQICSAGACGCPTGSTICNSFCTPTTSDPFNCGGCGRTCATTDSCISGQCVGCPLRVCGDVCVDVLIDRFHCGDCAQFCPGDCIEGRCSVGDAGIDATFDASLDAPGDADAADAADATGESADGAPEG